MGGARCIYDPTISEPHQPADPARWIVDVTSGPVTVPVIRIEETEE